MRRRYPSGVVHDRATPQDIFRDAHRRLGGGVPVVGPAHGGEGISLLGAIGRHHLSEHELAMLVVAREIDIERARPILDRRAAGAGPKQVRATYLERKDLQVRLRFGWQPECHLQRQDGVRLASAKRPQLVGQCHPCRVVPVDPGLGLHVHDDDFVLRDRGQHADRIRRFDRRKPNRLVIGLPQRLGRSGTIRTTDEDERRQNGGNNATVHTAPRPTWFKRTTTMAGILQRALARLTEPGLSPCAPLIPRGAGPLRCPGSSAHAGPRTLRR